MPTGRREALSDSVLAVVITVLVLQLPTPHRGGEPRGCCPAAVDP
jgi:uncharacterized membrane protein